MSNLYSQRVGAMVHCCMAWTQLVHVSTVLPQPVIVRTAVPVAILDGLFDISHVFAQVAVPLMNVLLSRPLVDVIVAETLVKSLLALVTYVFAESNSVNNEAALGLDEFHFLLEGLIQLLLSGRVAEGSSSGNAHHNRSSSILFRSLVSTALTTTLHSLTAAAAVRSSTPDRDGTQSPTENTSSSSALLGKQSPKSGTKVSVLDVNQLQDYQRVTVSLLEKHIGSLVDTLSSDVLHAVSPLTKCSLLSALSVVVSILSPTAFSVSGGLYGLGGGDERNSHEAYGSHAFLQAVQLLVNRRHLSGLLGAIGATESEFGDAKSTNESLFVSTLTLCTHLATTREGVEGLLVCGVMERINSLTDFLEPPAMQSELKSFGPEAMRAREEHALSLENRLIPALRLLSTMMSTFSTHRAVHTGVTLFLRRNHKTVSHLLRLRILTLTGLNMTSLVAGLLSVLVSRPVLAEQSPIQLKDALAITASASTVVPTPQQVASSDSVLGGGDIADMFVGDMCSLFGALGGDLLPPHFTSSDRNRNNLSREAHRNSTWWAHIQPEASKPSEQISAQTLYSASELAASTRSGGASGNAEEEEEQQDTTLPLDWSLFDHFKLALSLSLTAHLGTFLRNLSASAVSRDKRRDVSQSASVASELAGLPLLLLHLDLDVLCGIFVKTATQIRSFQSRSYSTLSSTVAVVDRIDPFGTHRSDSNYWLASPSPVLSSDLQLTTRGGESDAASSDDIREDSYVTQYLLPRLVFLAESLICVLHDALVLIGNSSVSGAESPSSRHAASIRSVLTVVEDFPSHSFVRQIARWIREVRAESR